MKNCALLLPILCIAAEAWQAPVFQSETKMVLVDAVVTGKHGDYVRDLTARDFRVWENNKERNIQSFSVGTDISAEPRRVVLFFDNTGMNPADQARVRAEVSGFIDANATPNRLMAVVSFDGGFRVLQSFTTNADRLKAAVRGVQFAASDTATAPNQGRIMIAMGSANARGLIQSVGNLAQNLNALPGRKIVVLFTGAGSLAFAPDDAAGLVQVCNRSNVALYPVVQPLAQASGDMSSRMGTLTGAPTLAQTHGLDMAPAIQTGDGTTASTLAAETGGFVVSGAYNLLAQLQKIVAEQGHAYVLGFIPPDSPPGLKDEPCYTLRVRVDRAGTEVRSRSGYCVEKPKDLLAKSRVEQDLEKRAAGASTGSAASIQVPFFYVSPNVARVHAAMEIATEALKFENQKGRLHAEMNILGIATTSDGGTAARFSDIVKQDFGTQEEADKWKEQPLYYEKEFRIAAGDYKLTVAFSASGTSFGKVETVLTVPAWDGSQFAIGGLALSKQVRAASELGLETSLTDAGTPLIADGVQFFPAGTNAFSRTGRVFGYFEIYNPDRTAPTNVNLRIFDSRTGTLKWDSGMTKVGPPADGKVTLPVGLNVPVSALPSGAFRLEVTATGAGDKVARRTLDIGIE